MATNRATARKAKRPLTPLEQLTALIDPHKLTPAEQARVLRQQRETAKVLATPVRQLGFTVSFNADRTEVEIRGEHGTITVVRNFAETWDPEAEDYLPGLRVDTKDKRAIEQLDRVIELWPEVKDWGPDQERTGVFRPKDLFLVARIIKAPQK